MLNSNRRIMALDIGQKRVGVAITDETGSLAQPLSVFVRKNRDQMLAEIKALVDKHQPVKLVLGLPVNQSGNNQAADVMRNLGKRIHLRFGLPVEFVDESDTTVEAHELMIEADMSRKRRMEVVDKIAATIILQRYLRGMGE